MRGSTNIHGKIIDYLMPFAPAKIGIFGSFARNEQNSESDLDILINLNSDISLMDLVRMERELSKILRTKVDLVTEASIKNPLLKKYIEKDLEIIFSDQE